MNILVDLRPLQSGNISGVEVFTQNIVKAMIELGEDHRFFLWTNAAHQLPSSFPDFFNFLPDANLRGRVFRVHTTRSNRILNILCSLFRYPKIDRFVAKELRKRKIFKKKEKFEAFFLPDLRPAPVSRGVKKYLFVHDLSFIHFAQAFSSKSRIWHKLLRVSVELKEAQAICVPSKFTRNDLVFTLGVDLKRINVVYEGVAEHFFPADEVDCYHLRKKFNLPKKYLLSLCTLEPRKNLKALINAFGEFLKRNPKTDVFLVVAGKKDAGIFAKLKLPHLRNMIFTGFIPEDQKVALYSAALGFVFPSVFEGFGLPVLEAMASGAPVLASNHSSIPEITGKAAILFDPLDEEEIVRAIEILVHNPKKQLALKKMGFEQARRFNWKKSGREILRVMGGLDD